MYLRLILTIIYFSVVLFSQNIEEKYKNMTSEEITTYIYKYYVNKLPLKINKFDTITGIIPVRNEIIFRLDTDLKREMYFINPKLYKMINFLKKTKKNFNENNFFRELLKSNKGKKILKENMKNQKNIQAKIFCHSKLDRYFLKKGLIVIYNYIDSEMGIFLGKYKISYKDCLNIK